MSKISELSDGGSLVSSDYLIAVRSGGNVKVRMDQINVDQVDLGDNEFIRLGNSQDLTMVHTSTQSIINQAGIGDLLIQKAGATKLTINSTGIDVTGSVTADGLTVDGDLAVSAANSRIRLFETDTTDLNTQLQNQAGDFNISRLDDDASASTLQFKIDHATGNVSIPNGDLDVTGSVTADGLTVDGAWPLFTLNDTRSVNNWADGDVVGELKFTTDDGGMTNPIASIRAVHNRAGTTHSSNDAGLEFYASATTTGTIAKRMSIESVTGNVSFYEDTGTTPKFFWDASAESLGIGTTDPATYGGLTLQQSSNTSSKGLAIVDSTAAQSVKLWVDGTNSYLSSGNTGADPLVLNLGGGNVGIGTSSPDTLAHLAAGAGSAVLRLENTDSFLSDGEVVGKIEFETQDSGGAGVNAYIQGVGVSTNGATRLEFGTGGSNSPETRMTINSNGNVGIGTSSPDSPLEIQAATNSSSDTTYLKLYNAGENVGHIDFENGNGSLARITGTKEGAGASANDGILTFSTAFDTTLSERMRIDASGNVGISNSIPSSFNGGANNLVVGSGSGAEGMTIYGGAESNIFFADGTAGTAAYIGRIEYSHSSDLMRFYVNNSNAMTIDASGNLLVGTSSVLFSNRSLQVKANGGNDAAVIQSTAVSAKTLLCWNNVTSGDNQFIAFLTEAGGTQRGLIDYNRAVGQVRYNITSDARLKDNIQNAEESGSLIDSIQVRQYDLKETSHHVGFGFIAQELQSVAPEAVSAPEDPEEMMGVDYSKLVPMMLKEIQSLRARVAQLES